MTADQDRDKVRALALGQSGWGEHGSAADHQRYVKLAPNRRRKCSCGCGTKATHVGMANGLALGMGCEFRVHKWARTGEW